MSIMKPNLNKMADTKKSATVKAGAGAVLVALSGFVPQPYVQTARAATTTTFTVKASFLSGLTISKKANLLFGTIVASGITGKVLLKTDAGTTKTNAILIAGAAVGKLAFKALTTAPNVDFTMAGMGNMARAATGGGGDTGAIALKSVIFKKQIGSVADLTFDTGGGNDKVANYNITKGNPVDSAVSFGGLINWTVTQPLGIFTSTLTMTASF